MQVNIIRKDDQLTHLSLVGRLDIAGLHEIDLKFHSYTAAVRRPTLVDLSGLEMITSLGIGMLISCAQSMRRYGAPMVLYNPRPIVEEAMTAVGLGKAIPIAHSQEEAMALLSSSRPA
jgi:anti-anti-sigma factor